jgi:hypothetical protein
MKPFLLTLLLAACAVSAHGQTIKAVAFNTTNNTVVSTNRITFPLLGAASGTAATPSLSIASGTNVFGVFATTQLGIGVYLGFSVDGTRRFYISTNTIRAELPISFSSTINSAETRTNLGIPLPALTNTSNVTMMRALSGSTNTNGPVNGVFDFLNGDTNSVSVSISNGIIVLIE